MKYIIDVPASFVDITKGLHIPVDKLGNSRIDTGLKVTRYTEPDRKTIENEVWDFVKRAFWDMTQEDIDQCYDGWFPDSYQEAKAKYEAWLKQKDEIRVGDEVTSKFGDGVVIDIVADESVHILGKDGHWNEYAEGEYHKTGRHFDEVEKLLKKMRGNAE